MDNIHHFCQGDSHKVTNKPCQDYAYSESNEYLSMAIVSDGHGGERYFRSQIGSELAVNITKEAIRNFVCSMEEASLNDKNTLSVFEDAPFTYEETDEPIEDKGYYKPTLAPDEISPEEFMALVEEAL